MAGSRLADFPDVVQRAKARVEHNDATGFNVHFYKCPQHGEWQANRLDDDGHEWWVPECPQCATQRKSAELLKRAGIPMRFSERTLESYVATTTPQENALRVSREYADDFASAIKAGRCLVFSGKPGTGKTHLAVGIAHAVMGKGCTSVFVTVSEAIRAFRSSWRKDAERTEDQVLADFSKPDLLILDEVGVQYGTEAEMLVLFEIINRRYMDMRPMVLISNLPLQGEKTIQSYLGERAFDRLREGGGRVVVFDWESHRKGN